MSWELNKGLPICLLLTFLALLFHFIHKTRRYHLTVSQVHSCKIVVDGKFVNDDGKLAALAAGLSMAVLLTWLLMLKIHGLSLWWLVYKLIPGAGSIRAVYRFQHVLTFPLAIVIAIGLHQSINYAKYNITSYVKRLIFFLFLAVVAVLLIGEEFNTASLAHYSKQQQRKMLAGISLPPQQAKVFALLPAEGSGKPFYESQIDAVIVAQKFGLHTINGYSGNSPPGWEMSDVDKPEYILHLIRWIQNYHIESDRLFFLDAKTGYWVSATNLLPSLQGRVVLMNGPLGETNFALKLSAEDIPAKGPPNEVR